MNFRFAHYDPPKKKTPKSLPPEARIKVPRRPSRAVQQKRQSFSRSPDDPDENKEHPKPPTLRRSSTISSTSTGKSTPSTTPTIPTPPSEPRVDTQAVISTYLGQGRLDPFHLFPIENVPIYVQELLDHAINNKWHKVSPSDPLATKRGWLQCALSSPVAFYALAFAASQHLNYLQHGNDPTPHAALLRLSYKTEAVKLINRALQTLNGSTIPDSLLIAILSLGAHGHKPVKHSSEEDARLRGPRSPLASAQMLDFYGHIDQETAHMSALRTLLAHNKNSKGEIKVQLPGLAGALALGDLLHSTITHQKPSLPNSTPIADIPAVAQFLPPADTPSTFPLRPSSLPNTRPAHKLLVTLTLAQTVTAALDHRVNEPHSTSDEGILHISIPALTLARNDVHHSLLSLPEANALWGPQFALYDALRIAGLVYSDLVLFPLPAETGVRGRYAAMMGRVMEGATMHGVWREEASVLLWVCLLGAVAAASIGNVGMVNEDGGLIDRMLEVGETVDAGERSWFVGKVRMCAEMLGVGLGRGMDGWEEVRDRVCRRYLWWGDVCDVVGRGVWEEVVVLQNAVVDTGVEGLLGDRLEDICDTELMERVQG